MTTTAAQLTKGTVVRFKLSQLSTSKLTVRLTRPGDTHPDSPYVILYGYRVRPADTSVSFGLHRVYCVNMDHIEIVQEA